MTAACSIYGLGLRTNVPIAGLRGLPAADRTDVSITVGTLPDDLTATLTAPRELLVSDDLDENGKPRIRVSRAISGHYQFQYADGTRVVVDAEATRVWAQGPHGATVEDTAAYLLGPTLAFVLRLRGVTCLHASAVAIGGRAVAFVGAAGSGKSSTAAALARLGHPVLTDDVAPLRDRADAFDVEPAYPRLRLWPDSAAALFGAEDALPRITPTWGKRYLDLTQAQYEFQGSPLELAAVYVLDDRVPGAPTIEPLEARAGLMHLVVESYSRRLLSRQQRAHEFDLLARLAGRVPMRRARASEDFRRIAELCEAIVRDLGHLRASTH